MPHRNTPTSLARLAMRDVYEAEYLVRGKRYFYSINSRGELHGERLVAKDAAQWKIERATESLWRELNTEDPIQPHERGPSLRLV